MTASSLAADPDLRLHVPSGRMAKPKLAPRSGPYHRLRASAYGGSNIDLTEAEDQAASDTPLRPSLPAGSPPAAGAPRERAQTEGAKLAIHTAQAFEAVQDSSLALCVEMGKDPTSAEQTLLNWVRTQPAITEMLDEQVGCVFRWIPGCVLGGNAVYKSGRNWYWWFYNDIMCAVGRDRSGWYLSKELWENMTPEVEDMI